MSALVKAVDLAVTADLPREFFHHVQAVGLRAGPEYGYGHSDFLQVRYVVGVAEIIVQLQGAPGHGLFALLGDPAAVLLAHAPAVGDTGDEFVVEFLGVIVERHVGVKPVLDVIVPATVVVPGFLGEGEQGAVHHDQAVQAVLPVLGGVGDHYGGG